MHELVFLFEMSNQPAGDATTAARETGVQMILQIQREVLVEKWAEPLFCVVRAKTKLSRANKGRRQQRQTAALIKPPIKLWLKLHQQLADETFIYEL